jgi:hypothetical protein
VICQQNNKHVQAHNALVFRELKQGGPKFTKIDWDPLADGVRVKMKETQSVALKAKVVSLATAVAVLSLLILNALWTVDAIKNAALRRRRS